MAAYAEGFHASDEAGSVQTELISPQTHSPQIPHEHVAKEDVGGARAASRSPPRDRGRSLALDQQQSSTNVLSMASALITGVGFLFSPSARAADLAQRFRKCNITFAKGFWGLTETAPLVQHAGSIVSPWMAVNNIINVPITMEALVDCFDDGPMAELLRRATDCDPTSLEDVASLYEQELESNKVSDVERRQFERLLMYRRKQAGLLPSTSPSPVDRFPKWTFFTAEAEAEPPLGRVAAHLLSHTTPPANLHRGVVLHIHGGGFVAQSPTSHESYLRHWTRNLGVPILSVDYSLAPEAWFPRAVDECYLVYRWLVEHLEELGIRKDAPIVFAGDSAGGNLVVATALKAAQKGFRMPDGVVCAYPVLNVKWTISPSRLLSLMDVLLPMGLMERCLEAYCGPRRGSVDHFLMSPLCAPDELLRSLPPIRILASEFDPLLDDSVVFVRKLLTLGHDAQLKVELGMPHGFLSLAYVGGGDAMVAASNSVATAVRSLLESERATNDCCVEGP
uniref:Hormone-sensitive lipase n=1 Tax=Eutreptiella gymnastica TaxID=73025 RepID=A0A7S4CB18_9EUGL